MYFCKISIIFNTMQTRAVMTKKSIASDMAKRLETDYAIGYQIGKNMRYFRKQKKITQVELAYLCNITPYIITNIESKPYYGVKVKTLKDIADAMDINICELICCQH